MFGGVSRGVFLDGARGLSSCTFRPVFLLGDLGSKLTH